MRFLRHLLRPPSPSDDRTAATEDAALYPRRRASHAGAWYPDDAAALDAALGRHLDAAAAEQAAGKVRGPTGTANACVAPHAGLTYSGATAAHAHLALREALATNPALRTVVVVRGREGRGGEGRSGWGRRTVTGSAWLTPSSSPPPPLLSPGSSTRRTTSDWTAAPSPVSDVKSLVVSNRKRRRLQSRRWDKGATRATAAAAAAAVAGACAATGGGACRNLSPAGVQTSCAVRPTLCVIRRRAQRPHLEQGGKTSRRRRRRRGRRERGVGGRSGGGAPFLPLPGGGAFRPKAVRTRPAARAAVTAAAPGLDRARRGPGGGRVH